MQRASRDWAVATIADTPEGQNPTPLPLTNQSSHHRLSAAPPLVVRSPITYLRPTYLDQGRSPNGT